MPAHQLKNGRWYTSFYYRTPSGELKQKYKRSFDTKEETEEYEGEFFEALHRLGIDVADNSAKARRDDWIFSLADQPSKKVSGERLGYTFGKQMLTSRFDRQGAYHPTPKTEGEIRRRAIGAVALNDLQDLSRLSAVLETCAKFDIKYLEDFDSRLAALTRRGSEDSQGFIGLVEARVYVADKGLMGSCHGSSGTATANTRRRGDQGKQSRQRAQEAERIRSRERGER